MSSLLFFSEAQVISAWFFFPSDIKLVRRNVEKTENAYPKQLNNPSYIDFLLQYTQQKLKNCLLTKVSEIFFDVDCWPILKLVHIQINLTSKHTEVSTQTNPEVKNNTQTFPASKNHRAIIVSEKENDKDQKKLNINQVNC